MGICLPGRDRHALVLRRSQYRFLTYANMADVNLKKLA